MDFKLTKRAKQRRRAAKREADKVRKILNNPKRRRKRMPRPEIRQY